jgi:hypothetical protein
VFVTGKGGVGKTSVAAGLALAASQRGRRTLLVTTDPARHASIFPTARWTNDPTPVTATLSVAHLTPDAALEEYGRLLIKPRLARRALFHNHYVQAFLRAVPGLPQWAVLGKAWYHANERLDGATRFDSVVFDAPATGHGLDMLRVPRVITEVAPDGLLRRDAEAAWRMFQSRTECCLALVALPEALPTNEAEELAARIAGELSLPLGCVVANRVCDRVFDRAERDALADVDEADPDYPVLETGARRARRERVQAESLQRLRALDAPLLELPELDAETPPPALARALAERVDALS